MYIRRLSYNVVFFFFSFLPSPIFSAQASLDPRRAEDEAFAFDRAASRLMEMQGAAYVAACRMRRHDGPAY